MPVGRAGTWGAIGRPAAVEANAWSSDSRKPHGSRGICATENVTGTPVSQSSSKTAASSPRLVSSDTHWKTPWPASASARAIATSSRRSAKVPGTRPWLEVWARVCEVEKPKAPASIPSRTAAAMAAISASDRSLAWARSPST